MRQCKLRKAGYDVDVAVVQKSHALCWSQRQLGVRRLYVTGTTQTSALLPRREEGGGGRGRRRSLGVWLRRRRRIMVVKLLAGEWEAVKEALWPDVSRNVFGFFLIKLNKTHAVKPFYSCQLEYWGFKGKTLETRRMFCSVERYIFWFFWNSQIWQRRSRFSMCSKKKKKI